MESAQIPVDATQTQRANVVRSESQCSLNFGGEEMRAHPQTFFSSSDNKHLVNLDPWFRIVAVRDHQAWLRRIRAERRGR